MKMTTSLTAVPETMLWTLHNRASEAVRPDGILKDPKVAQIYNAIDYDYERSFGKADGFHAIRAVVFDEHLREWIRSHPGGLIVGLAEGLETQCYRVDNGSIRWLSVELPEGIEVRERFIKPTERFQHLAHNALDFSWMDGLDQSKGVYITVQGLFMYLEPNQVGMLLAAIAEKIPGATLMFDTSPPWMSNLTMREGGWKKTAYYTTPKMPWGIGRGLIERTLRDWIPGIPRIEMYDFVYPRGFLRYLVKFCQKMPYFKNQLPMMVKIKFPEIFTGNFRC